MNTMYVWAASLDLAGAPALGGLRLQPGVEMCVVDQVLWLRGGQENDALDLELKRIPGLKRYAAGANDRWREVHSRIPGVTVPDGVWRPLREMLAVVMPPVAYPAQSSRRVPLTLLRDGVEREPGAVIVTLEDWVRFATEAPAIRLAPLIFAVEASGRVLVLGRPLPALPGERLVNHDGILIPCGWRWSPAVSAPVLQQLFALTPGAVVLLTVAGTQQLIKSEQFIPAGRGAARMTLAACSHA